MSPPPDRPLFSKFLQLFQGEELIFQAEEQMDWNYVPYGICMTNTGTLDSRGKGVEKRAPFL